MQVQLHLVGQNNLSFSLSQMLDTMTNSQVSRPSRCYLSWRMFRSVVLPALIAFNAVGCGGSVSESGRMAIHGKIAGAEGRAGSVKFIPIDASIGGVAVGSFKDGAYRFTEEYGPVPGEYVVSIEFEEPGSAGERPAGRSRGGSGEDAVDEKRTTASVSAGGPLEIDLDITQ